MIIIIILLFLISVVLLISWHDTTHFVTHTHTLQVPRLSSPTTICLLSDLHDQIYAPDNNPLIQAVRDAQPDCIVIAGDLLTAHRSPAHLRPDRAVSLVRSLCQIAPVYIAEGNHEHKLRTYTDRYGDFYEKYTQRLREAGAQLLLDGNTLLTDSGIRMFGLDADETFFCKFIRTPMPQDYLNRMLGRPDPDHLNLLVAHHPWYFPEYAAWGADLVLSGHVHGGIVRLPYIGGVISPAFRLFPKYSGGCYRLQNAQLVVSCGLGSHTIRFRLFNPGELVVLHLTGIPSEAGHGV
ncbi:MAG: metallophosphoesterase [Butyrivibrio sp.]|nr:metallophosphoesterase [Butyrivibrio sp.]